VSIAAVLKAMDLHTDEVALIMLKTIEAADAG
jgi:hypothetical protein